MLEDEDIMLQEYLGEQLQLWAIVFKSGKQILTLLTCDSDD